MTIKKKNKKEKQCHIKSNKLSKKKKKCKKINCDKDKSLFFLFNKVNYKIFLIELKKKLTLLINMLCNLKKN